MRQEEHHHKGALRLVSSRLASRLGFRWYDMYYLERSLKKALPEFEASLPLECSVASEADEQEILANRELFTHRRLKHRFASEGICCYVARSQGRLVGYSMLRRGLMDITGLDAREIPIRQMPHDTWLTHDAFVWPQFRNRRIFHALLLHVHQERKAAGDIRICNLIDPANLGSLKVHLDMGARSQRVKFLKMPGTQALVVGRNFVIGGLDC
jgi:hypothetical protein